MKAMDMNIFLNKIKKDSDFIGLKNDINFKILIRDYKVSNS